MQYYSHFQLGQFESYDHLPTVDPGMKNRCFKNVNLRSFAGDNIQDGLFFVQTGQVKNLALFYCVNLIKLPSWDHRLAGKFSNLVNFKLF